MKTILTVMALSVWTGSAMAAPPVAEIARCVKPPVLDGQLDEACWRNAKEYGGFTISRKGRPATQATVFQLAHDDCWLYLSLDCRREHPEYMRPLYTKHDEKLHMEESVEIFLDPDTQGETYFHFLLTPANIRAEQRGNAEKRRREWDTAWRSATRITSTGWTAEVAIPLYELAPFGDLGKLRFNLARNAFVPAIDPHQVKIGQTHELSHWSPVERSNHEPRNFGYAKGLAGIRVTTPFLASLGEIEVSPYRKEGERFIYDLKCTARGYTDQSGEIEVSVKDEPVTGEGATATAKRRMDGQASVAFDFTMPAKRLVDRTITVILKNAATGEVLQTKRVENREALSLMDAYLDRNYYTSEKQASAVIRFGVPAETLRGSTVVVTGEKGNVLGSLKDPDSRVTVPFDIASLPAGRRKLAIELRNAAGPLCREEVELLKRDPRPGFEIKIDRVNRVLLRDGKPFFPYGFVMYAIVSGERDRADFDRAKAVGANAGMHWAIRRPVDDASGFAREMRKRGMLAMLNAQAPFQGMTMEGAGKLVPPEAVETVMKAFRTKSPIHLKGMLMNDPHLRPLPSQVKVELFRRFFDANEERVREFVRLGAKQDNVLGYFLFDEPPHKRLFEMYHAGRRLYRLIHEEDGYRPTFLLYSSHIPEGDEHIDWTDCLGTDPYWVPAGEGSRGSINYVSRIMVRNDLRSRPRRLVTWAVPVGELWSGCRRRVILADEQMCQTFLSVIHGARAVFYFRHPFFHERSYKGIEAAFDRLRVLGPIAVTPRVEQTVDYAPGKLDPNMEDNATYPSVQARLFRRPEGGFVLLAANTRNYPVTATFAVAGLDGPVARLFGEAKLPVEKETFAERIEPMGVRAYVTPLAPVVEPVGIRIVHKDHKEGFRPERMIPESGRPGRKNILMNPSFEEAALPGWPDYWKPAIAEPRMGTEDPGWGQDRKDPWHGEFCLKIGHPRGHNQIARCVLAPRPDKVTAYTLSAYLRSDVEGMPVRISGPGIDPVEVKVSREWKRYSAHGTLPAGGYRRGYIAFHVHYTAPPGTVWVDGVQFEEGGEATAFED